MKKYEYCLEPKPDEPKVICRKKKGHFGNHKTWSNLKKESLKEWANTNPVSSIEVIEEIQAPVDGF